MIHNEQCHLKQFELYILVFQLKHKFYNWSPNFLACEWYVGVISYIFSLNKIYLERMLENGSYKEMSLGRKHRKGAVLEF